MPVKKSNRQNIVDFYRGNEEFVKRLLDLEDQMDRQQLPIVTPFLTSDLQDIAMSVLGNRCFLACWGGYTHSESCRVLIAPKWWESTPDFEITLLKGHYPMKYHTLTHRDVLGALMHQGVERSVIGDILVQGDVIYLFCTNAIAPYLMQNLTQIARANVSFSRCDEQVEAEAKIQWHTAVVSSLRLDTVVAAITHLSRHKAQAYIHAGLVKLNHVESFRMLNIPDK